MGIKYGKIYIVVPYAGITQIRFEGISQVFRPPLDIETLQKRE